MPYFDRDKLREARRFIRAHVFPKHIPPEQHDEIRDLIYDMLQNDEEALAKLDAVRQVEIITRLNYFLTASPLWAENFIELKIHESNVVMEFCIFGDEKQDQTDFMIEFDPPIQFWPGPVLGKRIKIGWRSRKSWHWIVIKNEFVEDAVNNITKVLEDYYATKGWTATLDCWKHRPDPGEMFANIMRRAYSFGLIGINQHAVYYPGVNIMDDIATDPCVPIS